MTHNPRSQADAGLGDSASAVLAPVAIFARTFPSPARLKRHFVSRTHVVETPKREYLLPTAILLASLGPITEGLATLRGAIDLFTGLVVLLPFKLLFIVAFGTAATIVLKRRRNGRESKVALAALAALIAAVVASLSGFPMLCAVLGVVTALGCVVWMVRGIRSIASPSSG